MELEKTKKRGGDRGEKGEKKEKMGYSQGGPTDERVWRKRYAQLQQQYFLSARRPRNSGGVDKGA